MNVIDENVISSQRELLRSWRISVRQIGYDFAQKGLQDDEIIRLLQRHRGTTFLTRDLRSYDRSLRHRRYCLVCLAVGKNAVALFTRRLLRHPDFNTQAKRMGGVIRVSHTGIHTWRTDSEAQTAHTVREFCRTEWYSVPDGIPFRPTLVAAESRAKPISASWSRNFRAWLTNRQTDDTIRYDTIAAWLGAGPFVWALPFLGANTGVSCTTALEGHRTPRNGRTFVCCELSVHPVAKTN